MTWLIVIGVFIVLLFLHIAMAVSGRKDGLLDMLAWLFNGVVIIAIIGLPIAGGFWLYMEGYQEDAGAALTQMEDAIGLSDGLIIMGSVMGVLGLLLFVKDLRNLLKKGDPSRPPQPKPASSVFLDY
jgi:hypothetical protein